MKSGVSALDYWQMTPYEVFAAIDAKNWQIDLEQRVRRAEYEAKQRELRWSIWHLAALERQKQLPTLAEFMDPPRTRTLTPEEAAERKKEFEKAVNALPARFKNIDDSDKG